MASLIDGMSDGDSHVNDILNSYIYKEPFGRSPSGKEQASADLDSRLEALQKSMDFFSKQGRSRTVERIWFEMARVNMLNGRWSAALHVLSPLWRESSWRRSGWFVLYVHPRVLPPAFLRQMVHRQCLSGDSAPSCLKYAGNFCIDNANFNP